MCVPQACDVRVTVAAIVKEKLTLRTAKVVLTQGCKKLFRDTKTFGTQKTSWDTICFWDTKVFC